MNPALAAFDAEMDAMEFDLRLQEAQMQLDLFGGAEKKKVVLERRDGDNIVVFIDEEKCSCGETRCKHLQFVVDVMSGRKFRSESYLDWEIIPYEERVVNGIRQPEYWSTR